MTGGKLYKAPWKESLVEILNSNTFVQPASHGEEFAGFDK